jgi:peroxiredoxin
VVAAVPVTCAAVTSSASAARRTTRQDIGFSERQDTPNFHLRRNSAKLNAAGAEVLAISVDTNGESARPAFFLVEAEGTISWRQLTDDYRVRVGPEDLLEALQSAG